MRLAWICSIALGRDRERFVREVMANLAARQLWWQRVRITASPGTMVAGMDMAAVTETHNRPD